MKGGRAMAELLKEIQTFKVYSESAAAELIEQHKESSKGLVTYKTDYKTKKSKGEIIEDWYIVTITHDYTV